MHVQLGQVVLLHPREVKQAGVFWRGVLVDSSGSLLIDLNIGRDQLSQELNCPEYTFLMAG